jgi:hypothetical protein
MPSRLDKKTQGSSTEGPWLQPCNMTSPYIDTKFTVGNAITIGLLLFSMVMAYSRLATKDEVASAVESIKKEYVSREVNTLQLQMLSTQLQAVNLKMEDVQKDVKEIKRWVK